MRVCAGNWMLFAHMTIADRRCRSRPNTQPQQTILMGDGALSTFKLSNEGFDLPFEPCTATFTINWCSGVVGSAIVEFATDAFPKSDRHLRRVGKKVS
ncbi:hypothetical protein CHX26_00535 [Porphyrobacter sp. HT-58-2]|nr:hypothetical protein CHX26_00535 [Porphyrobacter sp. HT-58-2]